MGPFLAACHGQCRQLFATALFTGMREGELFGLRLTLRAILEVIGPASFGPVILLAGVNYAPARRR